MWRRTLVLGSVACALVLYADEYTDLFRQAAIDTEHGNFAQAIEKYEAALKLHPGAPEALNNLAVMYYQLHRYPEAFQTASKIWRSHPELKSAALITGLAAVQSNRAKDAIEPLEALVASDRSNRDALLGLASAHIALQELPQAIELYKRLTSVSPSDANAWYGLAICYERLAEDASRKLSRMPGQAAYSKRLVAEYLQSIGDSKLASEAFGQANSSMADSSPQAARQYELARDLAAKSKEAFTRFVQLAPDSWQAALFEGDVERQHGNLVAALTHYRRAATSQTDNPAPLLGEATVYWEMGDFDRATTCLQQTLKLNPGAQQAIFELANIAVRRHQDREAIPLLEQYLSLQPDALAARADLGRAYLHLGEYEKAVTELTQADEADERGDVHYQLSIALRKLGRSQEADAALKKSVALREHQLSRERELKATH